VTSKLTDTERQSRKVAGAAAEEQAERERLGRIFAGNRAVDAVCLLLRGEEAEAGLGGGESYRPRDDLALVARIIAIAGQCGRPIEHYPDQPMVFGMVSPSTLRAARHAARLLGEWCRTKRLPPVMEVVSTQIAALFLRELLGSGARSQRTINNIRRELARLWNHAIREDRRRLEDLRNKHEERFRRRFPATCPMMNPWLQPETELAKLAELKPIKRRARINLIPHKNKREPSEAQRKNAPATRKRNAHQRVSLLRPLYDDMRRRNLSKGEMAWELENIHGVPRPNGGRWHTTLVGRDLANLYGDKTE
jgi:hypothetical protein